MQKMVAVSRAVAVLILVLTMVAGLFSPGAIAAQSESPAGEPPATVVPEATEPAPAPPTETAPPADPAVPTEAASVEPVPPTIAPTAEPVPTEPLPTEPAPTEPIVSPSPSEDSAGADNVDGEADEDQGSEPSAGDTNPFTIATDALELRARQESAGDGLGSTTFEFQPFGQSFPFAIGDSTPLSGATFLVRTTDGTEIERVTTGENGLILLDVPLDVEFEIFDLGTGDSITVGPVSAEDIREGRPVVTATRFVPDADVEVPDSSYVTAVDQIELRTRLVEAPAGQVPTTDVNFSGNDDGGGGFPFPGCEDPNSINCFFFCLIFPDQCPFDPGFPGDLGQVNTAQIDDSIPASFTVEVRIANTNEVFDSETTPVFGVGLLNAPVDEPFYLLDTESLERSATLNLSSEEIQEGRTIATVSRTVAITPGGNTGPTGDTLPYAVAADHIELRARYEEDPEADGATVYVDTGDEIGDAAIGESIPAPGVTFTVLDDLGRVVDRGTTDADGIVLLGVPLGDESFFPPIFPPFEPPTNTEAGTLTTQKHAGRTVSGILPPPPTGPTFTITNDVSGGASPSFGPVVAQDVADGRALFTATLFVADLDALAIPSDEAPASASASASGEVSMPSDIAIPSDVAVPSASSSASASAVASASAAPSVPVLEAAVVITGAIQESEERAGQYDYFYEFVQADEENDLRLAGAGEQTYSVAYLDGATVVVVDSGATDANGMVTLDAPEGLDYFIFEEGDQNDPYGSQDIPAGSAASFFVVEYVSDIAAPSASGSDDDGAASAQPSRGDTNQPGGPTDGGDDASASSAGTGTGTGSGTTSLPNTGAGDSGPGSSMTWALFALLAVVGVVTAGVGLRRRTV